MQVAVVGAGWAGLSAAIHLVEAGHRVTLIDAAPGFGGRGRGIRSTWHGWLGPVDRVRPLGPGDPTARAGQTRVNNDDPSATASTRRPAEAGGETGPEAGDRAGPGEPPGSDEPARSDASAKRAWMSETRGSSETPTGPEARGPDVSAGARLTPASSGAPEPEPEPDADPTAAPAEATDAGPLPRAGDAGLSPSAAGAAVGSEAGGRALPGPTSASARTDRAERSGDVWEATLDFDNGQHLVIGAYSMLLSLLARIDVAEATVLERQRFRLDDGGELSIPGPGVAGLALARGLPWSLRLALVRVLARIALGRDRAIAAATGKTVTAWSRDQRDPPALMTRLWRPLVISTMNTPPDEACAATFVRVLGDSLGGPRAATDFLIPRGTLSTAFVDPVLGWLRGRHASLRHGADIRAIESRGRHFRLLAGRAGEPIRSTDIGDGDDGTTDFDAVVLATPPANSARILGRSVALMPGKAAPAIIGVIGQLEAFDYRPISTVYLGWRDSANAHPAARLPVLTLLHDDAGAGRPGQWLFRRPDQGGWHIVAVVISDSATSLDVPRAALAERVSRQLGDQLGLRPADAYAVFHDRRATVAAVPDRPRLDNLMPDLPGVALAGDYQYFRYPATLESALRSGADAAAALDRTVGAAGR